MINLMSIIHKRNLLDFNLNENTVTNNTLFKKMLENLQLKTDEMYSKDLLEQIFNYFSENSEQTYKHNSELEGKITSKQEKVTDFINLIDNINFDFKDKITDFLNQNNIEGVIKKVVSFIDKIEKFSIK